VRSACPRGPPGPGEGWRWGAPVTSDGSGAPDLGAVLAQARAAGLGACLRVLAGPRRGETLRLDDGQSEWLLGRDVACGLRLPGPGVSRRHARLRRSWPGFVITPAGAKNGVWLRGRRLEAEAGLVDGDRVALGPAVLEVVDPRSALAAALGPLEQPMPAPPLEPEVATRPEIDPALLEPLEPAAVSEWLALGAGLAATGVLGAVALWLLT
jgi:hypothetical protein